MNELKTINPKDKLILVYLTEPSLSKLMAMTLSQEGCTNVVVVKSKDEARAILDHESVELFILNNRLGGISGEDFIRETILNTVNVADPQRIHPTKTLLFTGGWVDEEKSPATIVLMQNNTSIREIAKTIGSLLGVP